MGGQNDLGLLLWLFYFMWHFEVLNQQKYISIRFIFFFVYELLIVGSAQRICLLPKGLIISDNNLTNV